jgi:uncharacterized protein with HEPN domain
MTRSGCVILTRGIDLGQVWETAELDMPILKANVRKILQDINDK